MLCLIILLLIVEVTWVALITMLVTAIVMGVGTLYSCLE